MSESTHTFAVRQIAWLKQLGIFCLPFLLGNVAIGLLYLTVIHHFFRVLLLFYVVNFFFIPIGSLAYLFWKRWNAGRLALPMRDYLVEYVEDAARIIGSLLLLGVCFYASVIEPQWLHVEEILIESPKVAQELRILHISDIQSPYVGWYEERVFHEIERLRPDLIIHTGDLLQPYFLSDLEQQQKKLAALFQHLRPTYGTFNVVGDVDWRLKPPQEFDRLAGITTLADVSCVIKGPAGTVNLLGLSLPTGRRGNRELIAQWQQAANPSDLTLLFAHAPDYILDIQDLPIDLAFAGHTHGGQICLPFFGALITLTRIPRAWTMGFRQLGAIHFNVSAGIGSEHASQLPPIRFNCPPMMTLFRVTPPSS